MDAFGFLLVPRFSMLAFLSAVEPLRVANRLAGRDLYRWRAYSCEGQPVEASNGMRLVVEGPIDAIEGCGTVFVCAGFEPEAHAVPAVLKGLRRLARRGTVLGALDTGAFLLAEAGLLDETAVTLHWEAVPAFREAYPHLRVSDALYAIGENRISCAGGTAAVDLMLDRIAARHGQALAVAVSEQLIHDRMRHPEGSQRTERARSTRRLSRRLAAVVDRMERRLDVPLNKGQLAAECGVSVRQFERQFRDALGEAPAEYHLGRRLLRARHLLRQTDLSVTEIAAATGFGHASSLTRAYRNAFGRPPRDDRREPSRWTSPLAVMPAQSMADPDRIS